VKRRTLLCITAIVLIWGVRAALLVGIEPVVSTDAALMQMEDTTEGHVAARTYLNKGQRWMYSPVVPLLLTAMAVFFIIPTKKRED